MNGDDPRGEITDIDAYMTTYADDPYLRVDVRRNNAHVERNLPLGRSWST